MSELALLPNLGAEETGSWRKALGMPPVASAARLWRLLFPSDARVLGALPDSDASPWPDAFAADRERAALPALEGLSGCVPWLADADAHAQARAAGLRLTGPPSEIVAHVHDKAFALRAADEAGLVPRQLRGTSQIFDSADLESAESVARRAREAVASWPAWASRNVVLKPRLGTSGRGQLRGHDGAFEASSLARALPLLRDRGGAVLEPWLERDRDLSVQLHIDDEGGVVVLGSLELLTTHSGGFLGHRGEIDSRGRVFSGDPNEEALREAGALMAAAAASAGYRGVAGVDALSFRLPAECDNRGDPSDRGRSLLRPVVELNARFTMGTVAVGLLRRALASVRATLALEPGERRAFWFGADAPRGGWEAALAAAGSGSMLVPLSRTGDPITPALLFTRDSHSLDRALSPS